MQDYGMRIYNPSLGKFLSVDPLTKEYPWNSTYAFAENNPVEYIDLDGAERFRPIWFNYADSKIIKGTVDGIVASVVNTWNFLTRDAYTPEPYIAAKQFIDEVADMSSYGLGGYQPSQTPGIDAAAQSVKENVVHGDAYSRSKFVGQAVTDLLTAYAGSKGISAISSTLKVAERTNLATQFYTKLGESNIPSKLAGINFSKAVETITLKAGTVVEQWVGSDGKIGKYFAPVGSDANTLGIGGERTMRQFTLTEDVKVLKSTAADFEGNKGGGTQYFNPKLKDSIKPVDGN